MSEPDAIATESVFNADVLDGVMFIINIIKSVASGYAEKHIALCRETKI